MENKKTVLFVCTGNICRSPMAEFLFNNSPKLKTLNNKFHAKSAGTIAWGCHATPEAIKAMSQININISSHFSRRLTQDVYDESDIIVALMPEHETHIKTNFGTDKPLYTLNVEDPYGYPLSVYQKCRDEIITKIDALIDTLLS